MSLVSDTPGEGEISSLFPNSYLCSALFWLREVWDEQEFTSSSSLVHLFIYVCLPRPFLYTLEPWDHLFLASLH